MFYIKTYIEPEFEYIKFSLKTVICASASDGNPGGNPGENPIDDIIEHDGDDDV